MIISEDASQNMKEKFDRLSREWNSELIYFGKKDNLSSAIGKENKAVFAIIDEGFANNILKLIKELKGAN